MEPARRRKAQHPEIEMVLISCEREHKTVTNWPGIVHVVRRSRFWGRLSLWPLVWRIKKILAQYDSYEIKARGPHTGWIALRLGGDVTIQARGLLAEEYKYVNRPVRGECFLRSKKCIEPYGPLHYLRAKMYEKLEQATYRTKTATIEAVSPALKEYLVHTWGADPARITIAELDKPTPLTPEERIAWRTKIRAQLAIPETARVYCYAGSAKKWQCPEETVALFAEKLSHESHSFLLIYSQEPAIFEHMVQKYKVPAQRVRILSVPASQVIQYCAAADVGILLREQSPVNWVSRPTKALEYRAAGLEILHNNTVAFLM